jgi:shikimate kinase
VYLETSIAQQVARTRRSRTRPLLYTDDPRGRLESLMAVREPLYRSLAAVTVATDGRKVAAVADEIADRLRSLGLDC